MRAEHIVPHSSAELIEAPDPEPSPIPLETVPSPVASATRRLAHLDVAKGISILLVVLGHSRVIHGPTKANLVLGTIRMPLFFFVAGLFFKHRKTLGALAREKADSLLKPFFVTLAVVGVFQILQDRVAASSYFGMLAYGNGRTIPWVPMWFLPHLWTVFVFSWAYLRITRLDQRKPPTQVVLLGGLLVPGTFLIHAFWKVPVEFLGKVHELPGLPFSADVVFLTSFYFLLGFLLRERVLAMGFRARWFWPVLSVFVALHLAFNDSIDFNTRRYDDWVVSTIAAFCGVFLVLSVSTLIARSRWLGRAFAYVGSMSLFVLIFHYPLQAESHQILDRWFGDHPALNAPLAFLVGALAPLLIGAVIKRHQLLSLLYRPIPRARPS